jgi:hypothetical protein
MAFRNIQFSFAGGELSPSLYGRVDLEKYAAGARTLTNMIVHAHGGASNRPGTEYIGPIKSAEGTVILVPFQFSVEQAYVLEFGGGYMRVFKDGGQVVYPDGYADAGEPVEIETPYAEDDLSLLKFVQSADIMYVTHPGYALRKLGRSSHYDWTLSVVLFAASIEPPDAVTCKNNTTGNSVSRIYAVTAISEETGEESLPRESDAVLTKSLEYFTDSLSVAVSWDAVSGADYYYIYRSDEAGSFGYIGRSDSASFVDNGIDNDTSDGPPRGRNPFATNLVDVDVYQWTASGSGTGEYYLEAAGGGDPELGEPDDMFEVGVGLMTAGTLGSLTASQWAYGDNDSLGFDTIYARTAADEDPSAKASRYLQAGYVADYPGCATFFEQRLILSRTDDHPQTIYGSQTGAYENMNVSSPLKDDDAISFTIAARQVNEIRWMVPIGQLLIGTMGGEWKMTGADDSALTPSSVLVKQQGYTGSSHIQPIIIGSSVLHLTRTNNEVRDLTYSLEIDGYAGNNLSILANHLFRGHTIVAWAYQQSPDSIVWCVRDDGLLLGLTYLREHQVFAWHSHDVGGVVEAIASIPGDGYDEVWLVVQRTIGGATVKYIERLTDRFTSDDVADAFFVDCGLTYSGEAAATISGLDHLEGEAVTGLADGRVFTATVADGSITLPFAASVVHVGLGFESVLETLSLELQTREGTAQGRRKKISRVTVRLDRSSTFQIGSSESRLDQIPLSSDSVYDSAVDLFSGDKDRAFPGGYDTEGRICIKQTAPLPLTVLAVIPEVTLGG